MDTHAFILKVIWQLIFVMDTQEAILKSIWQLISVMNIQELFLIPKSFYTRQNSSTIQTLEDPKIEQKKNKISDLMPEKYIVHHHSTVEKTEKHTSDFFVEDSRYAESGPVTNDKRNFEQIRSFRRFWFY